MERLTTREIAEFFGVEIWRVQRLFEDGTLPEPDRFGGKRAIPRDALPQIVDALRARGWLPETEATRILPIVLGVWIRRVGSADMTTATREKPIQAEWNANAERLAEQLKTSV